MKRVTHLGIDLHAKSSWWYGVSAEGEVVVNQDTPNDWLALGAALRRCRGPVVAAVEAGGNWPWLVYGLQKRGCEVHLLHATSVRTCRQSRAKNDRLDAMLLAELAAEPWRAKESWICPEDWVWVRGELRGRRHLVEQRTATRNRIQALLKQDNRLPPVTDLFGVQGLTWLAGLRLPARLRATLEALLAVEAEHGRQIAALEDELWPLTQTEPLMRRIVALPQAGPVTALTIALESGDLARFRNAEAYAAHCGLAPGTFESAGKRRDARLCPQCHEALKEVYAEWAFRLLSHGGPGPAWRAVQESYRDHPVSEAKFMLARKITGAVRAMAVREEDFVVTKLIRHAKMA